MSVSDPGGIRAQVKAELSRRSLEELSRWGGEAITRFQHSSLMSDLKLRRIALYRSLKTEPDLSTLETELRNRGKRVYFPRVENNKDMVMVGMPSGQERWEKSDWGVMQPCATLAPVDPTSLDMIIVPGLAFGLGGERIGRGAGHYDRFLPTSPGALRIAIAFDCQIYPELVQSAWDQRVHWIFTQSREISVRG